ncbi:hypothetical protein PoB_003569200 [Plakobranchus ocellatus]|uniref:Uncharacterized protein n=1 Tax=Plakobranchus ocellatus TaxID=259542 RepID=A0AAV4APG0_9GAST|nr:hypothetical protein PoB_003569200 [Plakobranchus ocellatus]
MNADKVQHSRNIFASPQQGDLRLSGPPSGQGAGSGARTRDRMVPADLRADSQATVLPTPRNIYAEPKQHGKARRRERRPCAYLKY